jgi:hypothetical protein
MVIPSFDNFSDEFVGETVAFTHFDAVDYVRRRAFIMKQNHPGADIYIPVHMISNKYIIIIIQTKIISTSRTDKKYPASATSTLNCNFVFENNENNDLKYHIESCLCLYWQLWI